MYTDIVWLFFLTDLNANDALHKTKIFLFGVSQLKGDGYMERLYGNNGLICNLLQRKETVNSCSRNYTDTLSIHFTIS